MPGYFDAFEFSPEPAWFVINIVLGSIVYTWLYNNTARSILALVGFHFVENFVGQVTSLPPIAEPVGLAVRFVFVLGIVAWFGPWTFRRDATLPSPPPPVSGTPLVTPPTTSLTLLWKNSVPGILVAISPTKCSKSDVNDYSASDVVYPRVLPNGITRREAIQPVVRRRVDWEYRDQFVGGTAR